MLHLFTNRIIGIDVNVTSLPSGVDLCVFDFGVNAGTGRGARFLQKCVGAVADGVVFPSTPLDK